MPPTAWSFLFEQKDGRNRARLGRGEQRREDAPVLSFLSLFTFATLFLQRYYLPTSRELTRLESITSAPLIHLFSESINGIMVIRAFRKEDSFCQKNINQVNTCFRMNFHGTGAKAWFGFRLEVIGSSILCLTALLLVLLPRSFVKTGKLLLR